jgi:hypothetical protein
LIFSWTALEKFITFLDITPATLGQDPIVWAMKKSIQGDPDNPEMVTAIKKHLRTLFPQWEKIFIFSEEKQKTRIDSIDLSENSVSYFRKLGYVFIEEILKHDFRKFQISVADINRLWVIIKSNQLLEIILLNDTNLSENSREILNQYNITTLNQLEYYSTHDILRMYKSKKFLVEIEAEMKEHGLELNKDEQ